MAFVLVQHLDPLHPSALTQLLARVTAMPVEEASHQMRVQPDHIYVIAPDTQLGISGGALDESPRKKARAPNRAIDFFLQALAEDQRERAIGVILSGTASDGTHGLEAIKAEGGITFAQDESARYDSMPRSAIAAGCVDFVLSPALIAMELARIAHHPHVAGAPGWPATGPEADHVNAIAHQDDASALPSGGSGTPDDGAERARAEADAAPGVPGTALAEAPDADAFRTILTLLRKHCGVDFSLYKSSTIQRRITRRMVLGKHESAAQYAQALRGNAKELDALYSDALISVTSFFRNPETFDLIQHKVLAALQAMPGEEPVRAWVLGCSTGQEAYSIAMAFVEVAEKSPHARKLQVFATDLNEALLEKARQGLYAKTLAQDLSPERLKRFFVEEPGGYRITKALREMVVFARQNLISDPPFSRLDLITCRNLLIYLEPSLQKKVFPVFHYALKPHGFLWLGASESIGGFTELFAPLDRKHKIYSKKAAATPAFHLPAMNQRGEPVSPGRLRSPATALRFGVAQADAAEGFHAEIDAQREADRITVHQFAPPGVLINAELQVLQFRGPTAAYLAPPVGKASFDLLKMAREGLMLPLRAAIGQARKDSHVVRKNGVRVGPEAAGQVVDIEVIPLKNLRERCFLVLFHDPTRGAGDAAETKPPRRAARQRRPADPDRIAELEAELAETREYLQAIQEQYEAAHEELQASSEEVQSANEELQSLNEELETSKEELESSNEELTTVNEEMSHRNAELARVSSDLVNVQTSARLVIVVLGRDLRVRSFSNDAARLLNLHEADIGRPIGHVRHQIEFSDLEAFIAEVIQEVRPAERETHTRDGRWVSLRVQPYITLDKKVDGAVLVLTDIDELKRSEQAANLSEARYHAMFDATSVGVTEADPASDRLLRVNECFARMVGRSVDELVGMTMAELTHPEDLPADKAGLVRLLSGEALSHDIEKRLLRKDASPVWVLSTVNLVRDVDGQPLAKVQITLDITDRHQAEFVVSEAGRNKDEFLAMLAHELRNPLAPMRSTIDILRRVVAGEPVSARLAQASHGDPAGWGFALIERQVRQMARLIDDLLDVSRIGRGVMELRRETVELVALASDAAQALQPVFDGLEQNLELSLPPRPLLISADPARLTQVIGNLLNNASKFTPRGGRIQLGIELLHAPAAANGSASVDAGLVIGVLIRVRDNGIGIAADLLANVFRLFMQVDTSIGRSRSGLGIGLALVENLVHLHGGTVAVNSEGAGRGCEFVVRLPISDVARAAPPAETEAPIASAAAAAALILVVDDNHDAAESLAMWLGIKGFKTCLAHDGIAALATALSLRPDVVVLDLGLPGIDGYEVARRIRHQSAGRAILLIALTGWGQEGDRRRSREAGFDAHFTKPLDLDLLLNLLAQRASAALPLPAPP